jgi:hypothetical protein
MKENPTPTEPNWEKTPDQKLAGKNFIIWL